MEKAQTTRSRRCLLGLRGERALHGPPLGHSGSPRRPDLHGPLAFDRTPQPARETQVSGLRDHRSWVRGEPRAHPKIPRPAAARENLRSRAEVSRLSRLAREKSPACHFWRWELSASRNLLMIHPQVHLRIPCYDFYSLYSGRLAALLGSPNAAPKSTHGSNPRGSSARAIGSSDGRCVQRAETRSMRASDPRLPGIPRSWGIIASPNPY